MGTRLHGRVTAITGGALGIGRATALAFAAEGALVALGDVEHDAAEAVAREIREGGGQAIAVRVDVGDAGQVQAFVEAVVMIRPPPCLTICRAAAWQHRKTPVRLTRSTRCH